MEPESREQKSQRFLCKWALLLVRGNFVPDGSYKPKQFVRTIKQDCWIMGIRDWGPIFRVAVGATLVIMHIKSYTIWRTSHKLRRCAGRVCVPQVWRLKVESVVKEEWKKRVKRREQAEMLISGSCKTLELPTTIPDPLTTSFGLLDPYRGMKIKPYYYFSHVIHSLLNISL